MRSEEGGRGKAYQSCTPSTERSEHLNAGSSPALEGLQGQGTESLVGS